MDFGLSEDQLLLEKTLRSFLQDRVPIARVRELRDEPCPNDRKIWKALAELGATGVLIPEAHGGSGLSLLDAALVSESLGHAVTPTPFLSSAVMVPIALGALAGAEPGPWLAGIATGDLVFGVAATETFSVREGAGVRLSGGRLSGKALMALDACGADHVLLALGSHGLAVVRADAAGLTTSRLSTIDATRCLAELVLEEVAPEAVFEDASEAIARMLDAGRIALAADSLGACEAMIEQAVGYAQQRKQFDRVIGSFQAVKHMCAEMIAELEPARSLLWYAAHSFDALPGEAPLMASQLLAHVSEIGREIASVATQVHGGIGWTDEQNLHFWFKRIGVARHLLGGPEQLRDRAASLQGLTAVS
ncbi:MAG: acyl-CoA dehydrogenase family protein [Myxococcota bacterium]